MALKLKLPSIADAPDPKVELRSVYVEEWVEGLPYANPVALVRTLHDALHRLNRSPMKPATRHQLLELHLRPYEYLLELQEKHGPVHTIAALERQRADTDATRRVATELASGYKIVLAQSLAKKALWGGSRDVRAALHRATCLLSLSLLHTFDQYLPAPASVWEELYSLYGFAITSKMAGTSGRGVATREELSQSVGGAYKRILLTSLVDPYHLGYGEVWRIYRALGDAAPLAGLGPYSTVAKPAGFFVVDPDRQCRAVPYAGAGDAADREGAMLLDANPVLERLRARQGTEEAEERDEAVPARLTARIVRALDLPPKRHTPREPTEGRVSVAPGLSALHRLLGGEPPPAPGAETGGEEDELDLAATLSDGAGDDDARSYTAEFWELVNQGPGGLGVIKHVRPNQPIGVGEVIGLQLPMRGQAGTDWSVGVIRWLSIANSGEYQAGVQLLGRRARAVTIEPEGAKTRADARVRPAVALPDLEAGKGATLIVPSGFFAPGSSYRVRAPDRTLRVQAGTLVESTSAFDRFGFRATE